MGEEKAKVPGWLNYLTSYHNQGDSTFSGEDSRNGDFFGLDDLNTEKPEVVAGMIDIYKNLISEWRPDGFRVDTVKHVNPQFWQAFAPAVISRITSYNVCYTKLLRQILSSQCFACSPCNAQYER